MDIKKTIDTLSFKSAYFCNSIKIFDFSTLYIYTTIPHAQLKYRWEYIIQRGFSKKYGAQNHYFW